MLDSMKPHVEALQHIINSKIPKGSIVPRHDGNGHHYEITFAPGSPIVDSVTTKGSIMDKSYLKQWAAKQAIDHVRNNWQRTILGNGQREVVFLEAENMHNETLDDAASVGTKIHGVVENYILEWIKNGTEPKQIIDLIPPGEADLRVASGVLAAEKYCDDNFIIPVAAELLVASEKLQVAGTLDFLAFVGRERKVAIYDDPNGLKFSPDFIKAFNLKKECQEKGGHQLWQVGSQEMSHECEKCGMRIDFELTLVDWKSSNSINKPEYMMQTSTYAECLRECTGINPSNIVIVQLKKKGGEYETLEVDKKKRRRALDAYIHLTKTYDWLKSVNSQFDATKVKRVMQLQ